jgi:3-hydroxybutyryl-CoA dehydrogenase
MTGALPHTVAIVGAGTMGAGMAGVFASSGSEVRLAARTEASLERAGRRIEEIAGEGARRVTATTENEAALAGADLVVETITEELEAKRELLALAERVAPAAILSSNTSSLPLASIGSALTRPERFAGMHWFNPPELVELVEVVASDTTAPDVLDSLAGWMRGLGKTPIVVRRDLPGFVVNRLQYALLREAFTLVEAGVCSAEDLDVAVTRSLGPRWAAVGPFATMDLGGLDVFLSGVRNLLPELSRATAPPAFLERAVSRGELGAKTGRGLLGAWTADEIEGVKALRGCVARSVAQARESFSE